MVDAIVFAHSGRAEYLRGVLTQAKKSNPMTRVALLGDRANRDLAGPAEFFLLSQYQNDLDRLRACYVHKSSNTFEFEFSAIARWLAVTNFCRVEGFDRIFNADTDVLIYSDLSKVASDLPLLPIAAYANGSGHASYWSIDALESLRDLIFKTYEDRDGVEFEEISGVYESCAGIAGGISDMYIIQMLCRSLPWFDLTSVTNGATFDLNFNFPNNGQTNFMMYGGEKAITWKNGLPFGHAEDGEIRMHTLHMQGGAKRSIDRILGNRPSWGWKPLATLFRRLATHTTI
ncbi:hypothetical protein LVY75_00170 (plasmid) [Sinorhizobium sp. B11]